jgi:hypothetical protein
MATINEKQALLTKYDNLMSMYHKAIAKDDVQEINGIELQMKKIRIQLTAFGDVANPTTETLDEQPEE